MFAVFAPIRSPRTCSNPCSISRRSRLRSATASPGGSSASRAPKSAREIRRNFLACNAEALAAQSNERAAIYARLKLAGIDAAPVQLAVFCDHATEQGHGLGARTMPEMLDYSVVGMIAGLWLAARAAGLGLGWVSILDPAQVCAALDAPPSYKFIAFLCLGWPEEEHVDPELVRNGWQERTDFGRRIVKV